MGAAPLFPCPPIKRKRVQKGKLCGRGLHRNLFFGREGYVRVWARYGKLYDLRIKNVYQEKLVWSDGLRSAVNKFLTLSR